MIINYNLFNNTDTPTNGKLFKICFKAENCYDYEAPILECYEKASESSALGVKLDAQKATFEIYNTPAFTTQYCEKSYIELETEIWPNVDGNTADRFLMYWVDGVPAGVKVYSNENGTNFTHTRPRPITIGSDECDVYIYAIKVYERRLTEDEHLANFILDAPNVEEMLDRYNRNDILDDVRGDISYSKLIEKNPECRAWVYEVPRMTRNTDDKVGGCSFKEYYRNPEVPYMSAEDVEIRVQGTSSAAYGVAAFNMRSDFGDSGFIDAEGNPVEKYSFTDTAIPIDYFCTKVNVASCENANNALNQEWYNMY